MSQQNDSTASTSFTIFEEDILADLKLALVLATRFGLHRISEKLFTLRNQALYERDFVLADFKFKVALKQLDHTLKQMTF